MFYFFWKWLQGTSISTAVRESLWIFPALESIHIYSMVLLVSIFSIFDLRLMGFALDKQSTEPLTQFSRRLLRWGWLCFGINFASGILLFSSEALKMSGNWAFQVKIGMVILALVCHSVVIRMSARWEAASVMPLGAKLAGGFSILLWVGVITMSRWIAFLTSSLLPK